MSNPEFPPPPDLSKIKGIVFDLDDTLLNKTGLQFFENMRMLEVYGQLPTLPSPGETVATQQLTDDIATRMLRAHFESAGNYRKHYEILLGHELDDTFEEHHRRGIEEGKNLLVPVKGAIGLLEALCVTSLRTALFTSRDRSLLTPSYTAGIIKDEPNPRKEGYFDITISADDVGRYPDNRKRLKPHTAGFQTISEKLEIPPSELAMVGDLPSDLIPAKKMGAMAIGIMGGLATSHEDALWSAGADYIVKDLHELAKIIPQVQ